MDANSSHMPRSEIASGAPGAGQIDLAFGTMTTHHSFDENVRVGRLLDGARAFTGLLREAF
jgi:hypothetical protein